MGSYPHGTKADVKIRKLDDRVVQCFRAKAKRAGRSLEAELRQTLTDIAHERRAELLREITSFRQQLRAEHGELPDSTPLIREIRDENIG